MAEGATNEKMKNLDKRVTNLEEDHKYYYEKLENMMKEQHSELTNQIKDLSKGIHGLQMKYIDEKTLEKELRPWIEKVDNNSNRIWKIIILLICGGFTFFMSLIGWIIKILNTSG